MLISKYTTNNGEVNLSIVIHKNFLQKTKSKDYYRITLSSKFLVGLDDKKQTELCKIINFKLLKDNTKKGK